MIAKWLSRFLCVWLALSVLVSAGYAAGENSALVEYKERLKDLDQSDIESIVDLAKWCASKKLRDQAKELYQKAVALDPTNTDALRGAGYKRIRGRWLSEEQYLAYRGCIFTDGKWLTPAQYEHLVRSRMRFTPWNVMGDGFRVDTTHFIIHVNGTKEFAEEIAQLAESSFMAFLKTLNCREASLPREMSRPNDPVDTSGDRFLALAKDGGALFAASDEAKLTCWQSGEAVMLLADERELHRTESHALLRKGFAGQWRVVRPFMTAEDRLRLDVVDHREDWTAKLGAPFLRYFGDSKRRLPMDSVAVVWRAPARYKEPREAEEIIPEVLYTLAHVYARRFSPGDPKWFGQGLAQMFAKATVRRGKLNFRKVDNKMAQGALRALSQKSILSELRDENFERKSGWDRLKGFSEWPVFYVFVEYAMQCKSKEDQTETMLASVYRNLALGKSPREAIEIAYGKDVKTFQAKLLRWCQQKARGGRLMF